MDIFVWPDGFNGHDKQIEQLVQKFHDIGTFGQKNYKEGFSMKILRSVANNFEEITSGTLLVLMTLATFANVVSRYFFSHTIQQAEEFSRFGFVWAVFLGAALCTKHGRHIIIDGLVLAVPSRVRAIFAVLADVVITGLMAILIYYGWALAVFTNQPTATMRIPLSWVLYIVPFSAVLIVLRSLPYLAKNLRLALKGGEGR